MLKTTSSRHFLFSEPDYATNSKFVTHWLLQNLKFLLSYCYVSLTLTTLKVRLYFLSLQYYSWAEVILLMWEYHLLDFISILFDYRKNLCKLSLVTIWGFISCLFDYAGKSTFLISIRLLKEVCDLTRENLGKDDQYWFLSSLVFDNIPKRQVFEQVQRR